MRAQVVLLALTCILLVFSLLRAPYPDEQSLQHIPTGLAIALLALAIHRGWFSTAGFACLVAFLWLHILGARYIYSNVPYDDWFYAVTGGSPAGWFGWSRNHYDRFVHLMFGVLLVLPLAETAQRFGRMSLGWAMLLAFCAVGMLSALYEVAEWVLTITMAPEQAEAYNGQQGDLWDGQKDMLLAMLGAALSGVVLIWRRRR